MRPSNRDRRERSRSANNFQEDRERSREKREKVEYYMGPDLHLTKHYYFLLKEESGIGYPFAVWNLCVLMGKRPAMCLILCQSEAEIYKILQFNKLNRKVAILADHDRRQLKSFLQKQSIDILLMTNKKASILCALEETTRSFSLLVSISFRGDIDHYRKLHEFLLKTGGTIVSFVEERREIQKMERSLGITFVETAATIDAEDINKQLIDEIQFVPKPKPETLSVLKMLPFSNQEISARMFQILQNRLTEINHKSVFMGLLGYITYQIKTEVEFSSYKYVWNFLKDLPTEVAQNVRNMTKFANAKGAVFNIPLQLRYQMDHFIRKLSKNHKDSKFQISLVYEMPQIEDRQSKQYMETEEKKILAQKNKKDLEIFVGGLPLTVNEPEIRAYFSKNNVNLLTIRLMRDNEGSSKGVAFALCQNKEHVARALQLDESQLGQKIIRVHIAEKRQKRREN